MQTKTSKGRRDLKYYKIKILEEKLDEEGEKDAEKCDIFKHVIEDLKFYNRNHETAQADQKMGRELLLVLIAMLIMIIGNIKVITFHSSYVSRI